MSAQAVASRRRPRPARATARLEPAQRILVAILAVEVAVFSAIGTNFLTRGNAFEVAAAERRDRPAGGRADAGDRQRRHRPVGRLADGPVGRRLRQALARRRPADRPRRRPLTLGLGALAGSLNGLPDHPAADPAADRDARLVLALPRPGRGADRRRRQLHQLPRRVPLPGPGLSPRRIPTQLPVFVAVAVGVLGPAPPDDDRPGPGGGRLLARGGAVRRAAGRAGWSGWSTCSRAWSRASRRSSTSPTSARRRPTPARATSCWRSRRWCSAGRRSSAAGGASTARCWACSPSPCSRTACGWPTSRRSWPAS